MSNKDFSIPVLRANLVADYEKTLAKLDAHGRLFDEVLRAMPTDAIYSVTPTSGSLDICVSGDKHTLAACVRAMRVRGFDGGRRPEAGATSHSTFYEHGRGAQIWFSFTSKACRQVKVGTKMVEQDVFETVCNEMIL
jgi:hypothetical protein